MQNAFSQNKDLFPIITSKKCSPSGNSKQNNHSIASHLKSKTITRQAISVTVKLTEPVGTSHVLHERTCEHSSNSTATSNSHTPIHRQISMMLGKRGRRKVSHSGLVANRSRRVKHPLVSIQVHFNSRNAPALQYLPGFNLRYNRM